ncbi:MULTISPECIES: helix-turn-helix domain-containing protein [Kordiimonas]|jgi:transcriptional regulator with XRE-family HTH domain|uniref:helix-turn-helix domain-containing protein n=1 Tax=Kordiimonas TaxID=288021 RepID=UPI00257EEE11|nr:helix-turn-helix transcriptional regulator [Kordiimonas sp. UBA4487]
MGASAPPYRDLGFESGLHRTYVSGVERGVRNPTIEVLEKLALALDVSIADLVSVGDGDDVKDK